jgi:hypothetical protein
MTKNTLTSLVVFFEATGPAVGCESETPITFVVGTASEEVIDGVEELAVTPDSIYLAAADTVSESSTEVRPAIEIDGSP